jgi:hypothetical protein
MFRPQIKELETPPAAYPTSPNGIDKIDGGDGGDGGVEALPGLRSSMSLQRLVRRKLNSRNCAA